MRRIQTFLVTSACLFTLLGCKTLCPDDELVFELREDPFVEFGETRISDLIGAEKIIAYLDGETSILYFDQGRIQTVLREQRITIEGDLWTVEDESTGEDLIVKPVPLAQLNRAQYVSSGSQITVGDYECEEFAAGSCVKLLDKNNQVKGSFKPSKNISICSPQVDEECTYSITNVGLNLYPTANCKGKAQRVQRFLMLCN